jgi:hypothetical protein
MDHERVAINYKVTMSYMRFATKIFELENPQMLLTQDD